VAPSLFRAIRLEVDARPDLPTTVHLGESPEEVELLRQGSGPWRQLLQDFGAWTDAWVPPGVSPVGYLDSLGFLDARVLVVHGVQFDDADLTRLRDVGATVATCPRSNRYVGVGDPPIERFYRSGVAVAFGTDSLASVDDLNLFTELASARSLAPLVPASALLASATLVGARALGFGAEFGTIEAGKRASLLAVAVPPDVLDVEECLVSGVAPAAVRWLPAA
jgi:cytosine/adenosine deaminase-related metal-dependent hydrolase